MNEETVLLVGVGAACLFIYMQKQQERHDAQLYYFMGEVIRSQSQSQPRTSSSRSTGEKIGGAVESVVKFFGNLF